MPVYCYSVQPERKLRGSPVHLVVAPTEKKERRYSLSCLFSCFLKMKEIP